MGVKIFNYCKLNKQDGIEKIPFLEYINSNYDVKKERDLKKIKNIQQHILHIASKGGHYNQPPLSEQYKGRNVGVLKVTEGKKKIRIAFYTKIDDMMVILSAKDKPSLYEKGLKRKVDKEIEQWLDEAEQYADDLKRNPKSIIPFST